MPVRFSPSPQTDKMMNMTLTLSRAIYSAFWLFAAYRGSYNIAYLAHFKSERKLILLSGLLLLFSGCATVDFDQPREASTAIPAEQHSEAAKKLRNLLEGKASDSGFDLLQNGIDALTARLVLIHQATTSIDTQYYTILNDTTGNLFFRELLRAADRGVRVRLLLDDIATQGYDAGLAAADSHPNFEIRIRNPFSLRKGRYLNFRDFSRVNRRMHNKSLIVDNRVMIVGGRNIGDPYFAANKFSNFADLDVIGVGQVAQDASAVFDAYWNDRYSVPAVAAVTQPDNPAAALIEFRAALDDRLLTLGETPYGEAVKRSGLAHAGVDLDALYWVPYRLVSDPPSKGRDDEPQGATLVNPIRDVIMQAQQELILVSPYFVPRKGGVEAFEKLRADDIEVRILTNSLAATDVSAVHSGYAPSRKPLLKAGVKLYEVRADAKVPGTQWVGIKRSRASLHTKAFLVDRQKVFIGSFNFDPRSVNLNTEMGIFLEAPRLAEKIAAKFIREVELGTTTYEVVLNSKNQLRWLGQEDGVPVRLKKEPQTSFWKRFAAGFMRILPIRGQL